MINNFDTIKLQEIIQFIIEIDKLKAVTRKIRPLHCDRFENSAEHSWHLALFTLSIEKYCEADIDMNKVLKMLLIHDIGEIDTGDTMAFVEGGWKKRKEEELKATHRIFGILPKTVCEEFVFLWNEFEFGKSKEALLANALDRSIPVLLNLENKGQSWRDNNISYERVLNRVKDPIKSGFPELWNHLEYRLAIANEKEYFGNNQ